MTLTDEVKEKLIELVRDEPVLWNQHDFTYKLKKLSDRKQMWAQIAQKLGITLGVAKTAWKTLRDQFVREIKKIPELCDGQETSEDLLLMKYHAYGSWSFFPLLLFLRHTVSPCKTSKNFDKNTLSLQKNNVPVLENTMHSDINQVKNVEIDNNLEPIHLEPVHSTEVAGGSRSDKSSSISREGCSIGKHWTKNEELELGNKKKICLFELKPDKDQRVDDYGLCFFKGLLPDFEKVKRKTKLKRKIIEVIDDFLDEEAWLQHEDDVVGSQLDSSNC